MAGASRHLWVRGHHRGAQPWRAARAGDPGGLRRGRGSAGGPRGPLARCGEDGVALGANQRPQQSSPGVRLSGSGSGAFRPLLDGAAPELPARRRASPGCASRRASGCGSGGLYRHPRPSLTRRGRQPPLPSPSCSGPRCEASLGLEEPGAWALTPAHLLASGPSSDFCQPSPRKEGTAATCLQPAWPEKRRWRFPRRMVRPCDYSAVGSGSSGKMQVLRDLVYLFTAHPVLCTR